jgi:hypothetical protein
MREINFAGEAKHRERANKWNIDSKKSLITSFTGLVILRLEII